MNPLVGIFSPAVRKALYALYGAAALFSGAVAAYSAASEAHQPSWLDGANAVLVYVGAALGLTAASNVPTPDTDEPGGDGGEVGILLVILIAVAVAIAFRLIP